MAAAGATVAFVLASAAPAFATAKGTATSASRTAAAGAWGAAAAASGGSPAIGTPFTLTWGFSVVAATQYFKVVGTGTFDLTAETYTATQPSGPTVTLTGCRGATWNTSTGTCGGTQVTLETTAAGSTTATAAIPSGSSLSVRAQTSAGTASSFTTSITVTADRSQIRSATTTTS